LATGLLALLDDVAALVKLSAATLDDVPAQVGKTTAKVSGIVIDDAAVTPKYVVGLDPKRELAIIWNIAKRSISNKIFILAPLVLLLGYFAPWAITPLLMVGGAFLCFEGYEKVRTMFSGHGAVGADDALTEQISPEELERIRTAGAIRTDFILSAEIVTVTYSTVTHLPLAAQMVVLLAVGVGITIAVYGFVGLLVKADDFGVWLARKKNSSTVRATGRGIVKSMPVFLKLLGYVGTAAMLWVGAGIIAHGTPPFEHWLHQVEAAIDIEAISGGSTGTALAWSVHASILMVAGLAIGFVIAEVMEQILKLARRDH
jgi:uncharacterized protein